MHGVLYSVTCCPEAIKGVELRYCLSEGAKLVLTVVLLLYSDVVACSSRYTPTNCEQKLRVYSYLKPYFVLIMVESTELYNKRAVSRTSIIKYYYLIPGIIELYFK